MLTTEYRIISRRCVAILLHGGESADALALRRAVETGLSTCGYEPWPDTYIELFPGADGALLLARRAELPGF
jgi:hypothetical protein